MPAVASSPITPVLGQLADLIADGESMSGPPVASLMQVLAAVPDPRKRRGVRHRLASVLVMSVCAVLGGMRSFVAIAQWARDSVESCPQLREQLGGISRAPAESTIRRTLQRLDAGELDRLLGAWAQKRTAGGEQAGLRAVAVDGKTLRGSGSNTPGRQRRRAAASAGRVRSRPRCGAGAGRRGREQQRGSDADTNLVPTG